jgi:drug/metabolite transporter (DMT)-like permease
MKNILLIFLSTCFTLSSQLMLKKGMMSAPAGRTFFSAIQSAACSPAVFTGIVLQLCGLSIWLFVLTRANLSYASGFTGGFFYILLPVLTWCFFGERLTTLQWVGMVFLCIGVVCMTIKST